MGWNNVDYNYYQFGNSYFILKEWFDYCAKYEKLTDKKQTLERLIIEKI